MLHFAICDDDSRSIRRTADKLSGLCRGEETEYTVDSFTDPCEFLKTARAVAYDLVFLDIRMEPVDGFAVAEQLKRTSAGTKIVFLTDYEEIVFDAFPYAPLAFLRKSRLEEDMERHFRYLLSKLGETGACVRLMTEEGGRKIRIADILYVESARNHVHVAIAGRETLKIRMTYTALAEQLAYDTFVQINRGLLVNLAHIRELRDKAVTMTDGKVLYISRNHERNFRDRFFGYHRGGEG